MLDEEDSFVSVGKPSLPVDVDSRASGAESVDFSMLGFS